MTPTVGRIVWYYPAPEDKQEKQDKGQPYAAVVTHVWGPSCVNLAVLQDSSFPLNADAANPTSVNQLEGEPVPGVRGWSWMPYQVGQAAKTENVSAKLQEQVDGLTAALRTLTRDLAADTEGACARAAIQVEACRCA